MLQFKASTKIREAYSKYNQKPIVKCSSVMHDEGGDGDEGSTKGLPEIFIQKNTETVEPLSTST